MPNDRDLMQLHVEALFTHDMSGDLVRVNEPTGPPAPRFYVGRTRDGTIHRFRYDIDADTRSELKAALSHERLQHRAIDQPLDASRYAEILDRSAAVSAIGAGPAFGFPQELPEARGTVRITKENSPMLEPHFREWIPDVSRCQPMLGFAVDVVVVSLCCSVRQTRLADEAGVETAADYRGRNYARHAVLAWGRAVRECGRVPLYSTSWTNAASRAVARKTGLVLLGSDVHLT